MLKGTFLRAINMYPQSGDSPICTAEQLMNDACSTVHYMLGNSMDAASHERVSLSLFTCTAACETIACLRGGEEEVIWHRMDTRRRMFGKMGGRQPALVEGTYGLEGEGGGERKRAELRDLFHSSQNMRCRMLFFSRMHRIVSRR